MPTCWTKNLDYMETSERLMRTVKALMVGHNANNMAQELSELDDSMECTRVASLLQNPPQGSHNLHRRPRSRWMRT